MTTTNGTSSRVPSGSSTHSAVAGRSPTGSPSSAQANGRKLGPGSTNNMFGLGVGPAAVKSRNASWQDRSNPQVWANGGQAMSKRTASISSAASLSEAPQGADPSYRHSVHDAWSAANKSWDGPNSASGAAGKDWDLDGSPKKKDVSSQADGHPQNNTFGLHNARSRQAAAAVFHGASHLTEGAIATPPRIPNGVDSEEAKNNNSNSSALRARYNSTSPTKVTASGLVGVPNGSGYPMPMPGVNIHANVNGASAYDNGANSGTGNPDADLALSMRNMSVEEEYDGTTGQNGYRPHGPAGHSGQPHPIPQIRAHPPPHHQPPYNLYQQPPGDYSGYFPGTPTPESYIEYPYGYDTYRTTPDAAVYGSPMPSNNPSRPMPSGMYYTDFPGSPRPPATPYYYPHPNMPPGHMFPSPQPAHATMPNVLPPSAPVTLADKKRDLQFSMQQRQQPIPPHQQNMMMMGVGVHRGQQSPHAFPAEFPTGLPGFIPPGTPVFGPHGPHHLHPQHAFQQVQMSPGRRSLNGQQQHDPGAGLRSQLLEEFRANKAKKWELRDIFGYIVEFSGDQHGSRFIQQKLETATSEEKQIVFDEILPDNALPLITDVFGNYVIQKLFEHGTQLQKTILANTMDSHILSLSLQMYGCRVVQKAIECILPDQQSSFVKEIDAHVLKCVKDSNGNHVIQKLIERVSPDRLTFINAFRGNVYDLSTHPYGCRVLQRCFEHLPEEQIRPLLDELHKYTHNLMQDQFGNYVIQFVLEHGTVEDRTFLISKLRGQMLHMARHKFASNVCEKALIMADGAMRATLIQEMMTPKQDNMSPIAIMMKDQFANYVLQRALSVVDEEQEDALIGKIRPQLTSMRRYSSAYSKHLIAIEKLLSEKEKKRARNAQNNNATSASNTVSDPTPATA